MKNIYTLSNSHFFNSSISNPSLQSTILLTNLGKRKRVLGQSIKYKDSNKRVVPVGPKLAIPNSYDGFFELLSEDGRSVRCIGKLILWCKHKWHWGVSSFISFNFPFIYISTSLRNYFTISSKYFNMACYLEWKASSVPISFEIKQNDSWTDNIQSFELPF